MGQVKKHLTSPSPTVCATSLLVSRSPHSLRHSLADSNFTSSTSRRLANFHWPAVTSGICLAVVDWLELCVVTSMSHFKGKLSKLVG